MIYQIDSQCIVQDCIGISQSISKDSQQARRLFASDMLRAKLFRILDRGKWEFPSLSRPSSSIYLFRSNADIFLLKSFVAMNNGTCPTVRDRTATCKVCFPRDRQIITFQPHPPPPRFPPLIAPGFTPRSRFFPTIRVHFRLPCTSGISPLSHNLWYIFI